MTNLQDKTTETQSAIPSPFPKPPELKEKSSASDLKTRLDWGEPALTILDVRDRNDSLAERILGAVAAPLSELVTVATNNLETERDIYIYGDSEEVTQRAAATLREMGFESVAEVANGLTDWKAIGGQTEGNLT
ncbi:rhodanese-like domain-containing protein [Spirulina sp. CS-785/01]|uniref:rhodanese-like domain-containing protein n=1 Tax=Spirulina sp. CS-785/01 TaxID=3021716 RepID=UPI00232E5282|nr:rhodanese-like domain-containing protein [Spirulina sp. CS-785/01]MDB9315327.1 rhodanese-like domain-containing protein [Spirulina sp. CS-785/01]